MAKRFTDDAIYRDPWFRKLPIQWKIFWKYLTDVCDKSGVWKPDYEAASFELGADYTEEEAFIYLNNGKTRIEKLESGNIFIVDFISFQYGELTEKCVAHKPVFKLIEKNNLLNRVFNRVLDTLQEEEEYKDKEEEKEEDRKKRFVKPSLLEISEYIQQQNYTVEAESFFNFYESKGWKVGNQPMRDWRAAVRTWQSKNKNKVLEQRVGRQAVNNMESLKRFNEKVEAQKTGELQIVKQ